MSIKNTLIQEDGFGILHTKIKSGKEESPFQIVRRYTMTNQNNASVRLITWGAAIQSIKIPNKQSILGDIVQGFDSIDGYLKNRYIGRIINRLSNSINEKTFSLSNIEENYTSGGFNAIDNVNWDSYVLDKQIMSHLNRDRSKKYPVDTLIQVKYSWSNENELKVNIRAAANAPTVANITSYCPLNLAGHDMGAEELKNHVVTINADNWISGIDKYLPIIRNVECTVFDLRNPTKLKTRLNKVPGGGFNHCLRINSPSVFCYRFHGRILHPGSGRFLELYSDQPSLQFYTANDLSDPEMEYLPDLEDHMWGGCGDVPSEKTRPDAEPPRQVLDIHGKNGIHYKRHGAFVLSPQNIPAYNLFPGKIFVHNMTYKFGIKNDCELITT